MSPIDASIPLSVRGPQIESPLEMFTAVEQLRGVRDQNEARRQAADDVREKRNREARYQQALQRAMSVDPATGEPTIDYAKLMPDVDAETIFRVKQTVDENAERILKLGTAKLTHQQAIAQWAGALGMGVRAANYHPNAFGAAILALRQGGVLTQKQSDELLAGAEADPGFIQRHADAAIAQMGGAAQRGVVVGAGQRIVDPVTGKVIVEGQAAPATGGFTLSPGATRYGPTGDVIATAPGAAGGGAGFTLTPGATRYGPDGQVIASRPPASGAGGGRAVTSADARRIADYNTGRSDLSVLSGAITQSGATGTRAAVEAGLPNWITDVTGWGTSAKQKQALIDRVKQVIGKTLEGGVLRKEDELKYTRILPTIADTNAVVVSKLQGLDAAIEERRQDTLEALSDAGYDVSRFQARPTRPRIGEPPPTVPDLTGLAKGRGRRFTEGPFSGQTWTVDDNGQPYRVK